MSSVDSYRQRPHEELSEHLADINQQCSQLEEMLEALYAQRATVSAVIAEAIGAQAIASEVKTTSPTPTHLIPVAA